MIRTLVAGAVLGFVGIVTLVVAAAWISVTLEELEDDGPSPLDAQREAHRLASQSDYQLTVM